MTSRAVRRATPQMAHAMLTGSSISIKPRFFQRGFTYLGLMLLIAIFGIGLAAAGTVWHTEVQREKERELLFVGEQYARAIGSYYESTPTGIKQYPASLEDLLQDPRFPEMQRHLRKLYRDPITDSEQWGLIKEQGRLAGVYSLASQQPLKKAGFPAAWAAFADATNYAEWKFIYTPGTTQVVQQSSPDGNEPSGGFPPVQTVKQESGSGQPGLDPSADYAKQQICLGQRVSDTAACSFYCTAKGTGTGCSQCQASMLSRYSACLKGESLPPLADEG